MVAVAKRKRVETGFGRKLRAVREEKGLSQAQLADQVGMVYQSVAKYERGAAEPSWSVVLRFAVALGVSTDVFRDESPGDDQVEPGVDPDRDEGKRK